jgi:hypothetical protein
LANSFSTASPAAWPRLSLICLKRSTSSSSSISGRPAREVRDNRRRQVLLEMAAVRQPVSTSKRACCSSSRSSSTRRVTSRAANSTFVPSAASTRPRGRLQPDLVALAGGACEEQRRGAAFLEQLQDRRLHHRAVVDVDQRTDVVEFVRREAEQRQRRGRQVGLRAIGTQRTIRSCEYSASSR